VFAVPAAGELTALPNSLAKFQWAARRGGKGNVEMGGGKRKERKERRDRKGGVGLALRKKNPKGTTLQFIAKLIYRRKASHRNG